MSAAVGGVYGALLAKKKNKGQSESTKPKAAKVMSLKDTKEKKTGAPTKKAEPEQPKKQEKKPKEEEKELTKRETKADQKAHDRQPRSGHQPEKKGQKSDAVADALEAANEKGDAEKDERQKAQEEREAREAEEAKKMTLADYEKLREEKKKELGQKKNERKVDNKMFAKMTPVTRDEDEVMMFGGKKADAKKKDVKKDAKKDNKKGKFVKNDTLQLGFISKPQQAPRGDRNFNRGPRREEKKEEKKAVPASAE